MPPFVATILLFMHVAAFTTILMSGHALASPAAMPLPWMRADYSRNTITPTEPTEVKTKTTHVALYNQTAQIHRYSRAILSSSGNSGRDTDTGDDSCSQLPGYANDMNGKSTNSQQATASAFYTSSQSCWQYLSLLGGQQDGLANYNPDDAFQTGLKNFVNANKSFLDILAESTEFDPALFDIIEAVKCLLDEVLDFTENLTDGLLNLLGLEGIDNLVQSLIDQSLLLLGLPAGALI